MGLFFEDKKPETPPPQIIQEAQWGPIVIFLAFLSALGVLFSWTLKPMLLYLFTFEGRTSNQIKTQLLVIAALVLGPLLALYTLSPAFRDRISLSETRTINHTARGDRVFHPDRSYFVIEGTRRGEIFDSKTYITYAGHTDGTFQKINPGQCQMLPRGQKIRLGSVAPPTNAEGFKDTVSYHAHQQVMSLSGFDYMWEWSKRPALWLNKRELDITVVEVDKTSNWKQFVDDWDIIRKDQNMYRSFEVKALAREHAVICF